MKQKRQRVTSGTKRLKLPPLPIPLIRTGTLDNLFEDYNPFAKLESNIWEEDPMMEVWEQMLQREQPQPLSSNTETPNPSTSAPAPGEQTLTDMIQPVSKIGDNPPKEATTSFLEQSPPEPEFKATQEETTIYQSIQSKQTWDAHIRGFAEDSPPTMGETQQAQQTEWEQHFLKQETYEKVRGQIRRKQRLSLFQAEHNGKRLPPPTPEDHLKWNLRLKRIHCPTTSTFRKRGNQHIQTPTSIELNPKIYKKIMTAINPRPKQTPQKRKLPPAETTKKLKKTKGGATHIT
jgi:hypothetical protein